MIFECLEPLTLAKLVAFSLLQVLSNHFRNQFLKCYLGRLAEICLRLRRITKKRLDFGWTKIFFIYFYNNLSCLAVDAFLLDTTALPSDGDTNFFKCSLNEFPDRMLLSCRNYIILRRLLLEHHPLRFNIVFCMTPVAKGI